MPPGHSIETHIARELVRLDANWEGEGYIAAGEARKCVEVGRCVLAATYHSLSAIEAAGLVGMHMGGSGPEEWPVSVVMAMPDHIAVDDKRELTASRDAGWVADLG